MLPEFYAVLSDGLYPDYIKILSPRNLLRNSLGVNPLLLLKVRLKLAIMWRNKYDPTHTGNHYYGPWSGHASAPDFLEFHKSPITLFSKDLPDMYKMADGVTVD